MAVELNHTIIKVRDKQEAADFFARLLDLEPAKPMGPFMDLRVYNSVRLYFADTECPAVPTHYAFLVSEDEFDGVLSRIREDGLDYWADPFLREPGAINHDDGGRGVYCMDPNRHFLEVITVPYGGWDS
jgi:catechol 2,3-dioxygenase-like lactoylglutathione lyase family enzyme